MGWRFALFLPVDEVTAGIVKGRNISIYICVAVIIVAVMVSLVVVTILLRPLDTVAALMYRVAMMQDMDSNQNDDGDDNTRSSLLEIATIQMAFTTMTSELAKIKNFLPQSVLEQLYGGSTSPSDDDEGDMESVSYRKKSMDAGSDESSRHQRTYTTNPTNASSGDASKSTGGGVVPLNTTVSLSNRKVTMLCLNILQYHQHSHDQHGDDLVKQHGYIVKCVTDACFEYRGVMDGFQGDRFTISFNAVTHVGNHSVQAAQAAISIIEGVAAHTPLVVSSGLASGTATVGNMGSATTKRFTILSPVVATAVLLERLSKKYCHEEPSLIRPTLVAGSAVLDLDATYELLTLDSVILPISKGRQKRTRVCGIMAAKEVSADEWMYEMQEGIDNSKYGRINETFGLFLDGMVASAGDAARIQQLAMSHNGGTSSSLVRSVLGRIQQLVQAAAAAVGSRSVIASDAEVSQFGLDYANPLTDYFTKCALPTPNHNKIIINKIKHELPPGGADSCQSHRS